MEVTEKIYEAAWVKRDKVTAKFKAQLEEDMIEARKLPYIVGQFGQQCKAVSIAVDRYQEACEPAVAEWQRDLGIIEK